jgi:hypothetical protein
MATLEIEGDTLTLQIHGWDKLVALRNAVSVKLAHVGAVTVRPPDADYDEMKGLRLAGGYWPRAFAGGYFWITGGPARHGQEALEHLENARKQVEAAQGSSPRWADALRNVDAAIETAKGALAAAGVPEARKYLAFYQVKDPAKAIGIDVEDETVRRIVVEIEGETPEEAAARIRSAVPAR